MTPNISNYLQDFTCEFEEIQENQKSQRNINETGDFPNSLDDIQFDIFNTNVKRINEIEIEIEKEIKNYFDKEKIEMFKRKFDEKFEPKRLLFADIDKETLEYCVLSIIKNILYCNPMNINIEVTDEKSIQFTSKCDESNLYIDLFFDTELDDFAEVAITVFKNKKAIYSFGGDFYKTIIDFEKNYFR